MLKLLSKRFKNEERGFVVMIGAVFFVFFAMIVIMVVMSTDVHKNLSFRIDNTLEFAAELRAQKVNNPLKEAFGIIEAMPSDQLGRPNFEAANTMPLGYDYRFVDVRSPENIAYINQLNADTIAYIKEDVALNTNGFAEVEDGDICIKTITLPNGRGGRVDVSCEFNGETTTFKPHINGLDHHATSRGDLQVTNAVFIATKLDVKWTFKDLPSLLNEIESFNDDGTVTVETYAIAYPHLEEATSY